MTAEPAKVFEDRRCPGDWRVEWVDDDGGVEVAIFSGPNAREWALRYAERQYPDFEVTSPGSVSLTPRPASAWRSPLANVLKGGGEKYGGREIRSMA